MFQCPILAPFSLLQLQNKLKEARNTLQADIDPVTGKRLFHPETGRAPTGLRRAGDTPIGEHLYNLRQQLDEKARAALDEQDRKQREIAARAKQSKGSRELIKTLQHKRFKQVGRLLLCLHCAGGPSCRQPW